MDVRRKRGVDSLERAFELLEAFRDAPDSLSLSDLAAKTGLYKSTILRLFVSLERYGYLVRVESGRFALGSTLFELGNVYRKMFRLVDRVRPVLERLAAQTKESASFWVLENGHRVCLCRVESPQNVREAMFREGDRRPLDKGPTSTLLRAFSGARGKRFDEVRRDVAAVSIGLYRTDVAGISCPVFAPVGELAGAVTLTGPRQRFDERAVGRMKAAVSAAAEEITRSLAAKPWK
ncbi:MAG TPA: IclR family transcriptional regulator [Burkholderiales bacterium]|jgi:DNA-binding IclR family transcriptional regulator|nr:IclR family transcriptional regulator [Burkholderiales bacterium]